MMVKEEEQQENQQEPSSEGEAMNTDVSATSSSLGATGGGNGGKKRPPNQQQSSLDAYFGVKPKKTKGGKQTKINFPVKGKASATATQESTTTADAKEKENAMSNTAVEDESAAGVVKAATPAKKQQQDDDATMENQPETTGSGSGKRKIRSTASKNKKPNMDDGDSDDDENMFESDKKKATSASSASKSSPSKRRRRHVIDNDDDDDENDTEVPIKVKEETKTKAKPCEPRNDDAGSNDDDDKKAAISSSATASTNPAQKSSCDSSKTLPSSDTKASIGSSSSNTKKQANAEATTSKGQPNTEAKATQKGAKATSSTVPAAHPGLPYSRVCQTFEEIEAIAGRLQIQQILTKLIREVLDQVCSSSSGGDSTVESANKKAPRSSSSSSQGDATLDLKALIYLCSNDVAPAYDCVELGIGDSLLIKAIAEATGTTLAKVKERYETVGDLGTVAQNCKSKQRTLGGFFAKKPASSASSTTTVAAAANGLFAQEVLTTFREIANTKGNQSQKGKVDKIKKLLVKASTSSPETKYIIRGLQGKLRIGLAKSTVLIALAHALAETASVDGDKKNATKAKKNLEDYPEEAKQYLDPKLPKEKRLEAAVAILKRAYNEVSSYDIVVDAALKHPLEEMHHVCTLMPGIPVSPMLAKPTKSIQEILKRLSGLNFTCEFKYDGERAQVHMLPDGTTKVFSRNLLDTSEKYPEVPLFVKEAAGSDVKSFVMDAEVVAFNKNTGQLVPFQILSTRKKTEESFETAKVKVIVQAFDLMYLNGESLLTHSLAHRRKLLHEHFQPVQDKFKFATSLDHKENGDTIVIEEFLDQAVKGQCEGLMIKTLDVNAIYEPSRRTLNWLKLKKDYLEGLGDSVDLVPLGAYHGRGKRTGVYGAYLLACYDPDSEEFQSVCKIGTGFSDENLKELAAGLNEHMIPQKSRQYNVSDQLECDVWFDAVQVWEVRAADLSQSSAHRGAHGKTGEAGRGIGLRFPRFERKRDDKSPVDATTSDQILEMYYQQDTITAGGNGGGGADGWDDDDGI